MPLTRLQKSELKKLEESCKQMEKLTQNTDLLLNDYLPDPYYFPDLSSEEKKIVIERSRNRRQVFEESKRRNAT